VAELEAWVHHNTLVWNTGNVPGQDSTWGGGIGISHSPNAVIEQNIIARSPDGGGIRCVGAAPVIRNNLLWGNVGGTVIGCGSAWETEGNVTVDPYFCDVHFYGYTLAANSPGLAHPAGPLGALPDPGCSAVAVIPMTWGRIKARY
jgi:hypothetical protein